MNILEQRLIDLIGDRFTTIDALRMMYVNLFGGIMLRKLSNALNKMTRKDWIAEDSTRGYRVTERGKQMREEIRKSEAVDVGAIKLGLPIIYPGNRKGGIA